MKKESNEESLVKEITFHKKHLQKLQHKLDIIRGKNYLPDPEPGMVFFRKSDQEGFILISNYDGSIELRNFRMSGPWVPKRFNKGDRGIYGDNPESLEFLGDLTEITAEIASGIEEGIRILGAGAHKMSMDNLIYGAFEYGKKVGSSS